MYWTAILYKNPAMLLLFSGTVKRLPKAAIDALTPIYKQIENYNSSKTNVILVLNHSGQFRTIKLSLCKLNSRNKAI